MEQKVTIIVLCYSNYHLIFPLLDSIFMQNYAKIQLIISDDASSDFSMKNIKSYCKKNAGLNIIDLQILQNDMNLGTVEHLKKIYPLCIGDILWILGADDILVKKDAVSCFVTEFNKNSNTMILTSQVALYDENLEVQKGYYLCSEGIEPVSYTHLDVYKRQE